MPRADPLLVTARVRIGTSGWEYEHWRGDFYPPALARSRWLEYYTERFDTVELNASFYRLPLAATFERWRRRVPARFVFAVKASRYLTHVKRLSDPAEPLDRLWSRAGRLSGHLGPVLYQLPPRWLPNPERLDAFLAAVPRGHHQALEFRDRRWYVPAILQRLEPGPVSLCLHDMPGSEMTADPLGPIVYVRFHGAGQRYGGGYAPDHLQGWASRIVEWAAEDRPVWAYFNNDIGGHAVRDAATLREMVAGLGADT